jgi:hypothetical protein
MTLEMVLDNYDYHKALIIVDALIKYLNGSMSPKSYFSFESEVEISDFNNVLKFVKLNYSSTKKLTREEKIKLISILDNYISNRIRGLISRNNKAHRKTYKELCRSSPLKIC